MDLAAQVAIPTIDWGEVATVLIGTPIKIVLIVLVCIASWIVLTSIINRVTKRLVEKAEADRLTLARRTQHPSDLSAVLMSQRRRARAEAIASLLRSITSAFIACIGVLLVLAQLEINITPLLASAGVIGVALGFGAQSLVKDYLSGIFLILEDQYGVGDVVDLGPVVGTVEEVTLRVTRVRDMSGVVWYVRNGEVLRVVHRGGPWRSWTYLLRTTRTLTASRTSSRPSQKTWIRTQSTTRCCSTSLRLREWKASAARRSRSA